jgi:hypothetical protein
MEEREGGEKGLGTEVALAVGCEPPAPSLGFFSRFPKEEPSRERETEKERKRERSEPERSNRAKPWWSLLEDRLPWNAGWSQPLPMLSPPLWHNLY